MAVIPILFLLLAPAPSSPPVISAPVSPVQKQVEPLHKPCGAGKTAAKPSGNSYPESYGAACELQHEVREMSRTLSDEPIEDAYGSADQWEQIDRDAAQPVKDKNKDKAKVQPKPQTP